LREEVGIENIYIDPFPDFLVQEGRERERREKSEELITSRRQTCGGGRKKCAQTYIHIII